MTFGKWQTPAMIEGVREQLERAFLEILFRSLITEIRKATRQTGLERLNGPMDPLHEALRSGQIQLDTATGEFSGEFSAAVSRPLEQLGARFDKRRKVYRIRPTAVPSWILADANVYHVTAQQAHAALKRVLSGIQVNLDELVEKHAISGASVAEGVAVGYRELGKAIGIQAPLSPEAQAKLSREYTKNVAIHVRDFSNKMVGQLRETVEENALSGYRFDRLISKIEGRYEVTKSKARFLAQNETAFFMATHREARFAEVGITHYAWSDSRDERVRGNPDGKYPPSSGCGDHWHLHGKTFSYANPPVVEPKTGRRANPGKDYNCRCVDKPKLPAVKKRLAVAA